MPLGSKTNTNERMPGAIGFNTLLQSIRARCGNPSSRNEFARPRRSKPDNHDTTLIQSTKISVAESVGHLGKFIRR